MEILQLLPIELQNKVKYFVLQHPTAKIIRDEIKRSRCDEYYTFRDESGKIFCKVDGKDFFANQYFYMINKRTNKSKAVMSSEGMIEYDDSDSSDEYIDDVFGRLFFVSSETTSDDD